MEVGFEAAENRIAFGGGELEVEEFFGCDEVGEEGSILGGGGLCGVPGRGSRLSCGSDG